MIGNFISMFGRPHYVEILMLTSGGPIKKTQNTLKFKRRHSEFE
jgi:hypothetical protein